MLKKEVKVKKAINKHDKKNYLQITTFLSFANKLINRNYLLCKGFLLYYVGKYVITFFLILTINLISFLLDVWLKWFITA